MSQFAQQGPERQIPWLPGERFELALDSREGAINSSMAGADTLTVTTHRVIRLGVSGGAKTTEVAPLDRVSAVEVLDVSRDNGRLTKALIALGAGLLLAWLTWNLFDHVVLFSLVAGGLPVLGAVYLLTGYLFPDEEGALLLHCTGHTMRQPLLSEQSRHDAYLVAHRIYELMAGASNRLAQVQTASAAETPPASAAPANPYLGTPARPTPRAAASSNGGLAAMMAGTLTADRSALVPDVAERIARSIDKTASVTSYATRQTLRDPSHETMAAGDYVWEMEYAAPDRYRVTQTGWSDAGEVTERWLIAGADFYRDARGTWRRSEEPGRFATEQTLTKHLSPAKYLDILRQGFPSSHEVDADGGSRYLQVGYGSLTREALAAVLANPSPPQGVDGAAKLWLDMETDLLARAEVRIAERDGDRKLVFEQVFASYNAGQPIEPPVVAGREPVS